MERLQTAPAAVPSWAERRRRVSALRERWLHAEEMLSLYAALLSLQERAAQAALDDRPSLGALAGYVAARVIPDIVEVTRAAGPPTLVAAVAEPLGDPDAAVRRWLAGEPQPPVPRAPRCSRRWVRSPPCRDRLTTADARAAEVDLSWRTSSSPASRW
jgi:hypothetical protein